MRPQDRVTFGLRGGHADRLVVDGAFDHDDVPVVWPFVCVGTSCITSPCRLCFYVDMRRAVVVILVVAVSSLLTGCDNFQEFTVQNPCDFEVKVAFDSGSNPPADQLWPFAEAVPARGERHILTGAPAGIPTVAVQIRAPGRSPVVEVIRVSEDGQTWQIPETFCRS